MKLLVRILTGAAAYWAKIARASALEICRAAPWSSLCTLATHYHLDLAREPFGSHNLTWLREDDGDKANAETPFPSSRPFLSGFCC